MSEIVVVPASEPAPSDILLDGCGKCPWGKKAGRKVPGYLQKGSDLLIVGEGPGVHEQQRGVPFVGPSGKLLQDALHKAGISYTQTKVSVTNATLCKPPEEKTPTMMAECVSACRGRLLDELGGEHAKLVLALGDIAVKALLGNVGKITDIHGMAFTSPHQEGQTIVACLHPAAILRTPSLRNRFQTAIDYAVELVQGKTERRHPGETKYKLVKWSEMDHVVDRLLSLPEGHVLGADIETTGFARYRDRIIVLGLAWERNKVLVFTDALFEHPAFRRLIESKHLKWVWHNGKFDVSFFQAKGYNARIDGDTMLMHYALNEISGTHGLEQLAGERLGADAYKEETDDEKKRGFVGAAKEKLFKYVARDADYTRQLYFNLAAELDLPSNQGLWDLYHKILLPAAHLLIEVERNGIFFSKEAAAVAGAKLQEEWDIAHAKLQEDLAAAWVRTRAYRGGQTEVLINGKHKVLNPNSPKQVFEVVYEHLLMNPPHGFPKDTGKDTLKAMPPHPVLDGIRHCRAITKLKSTNVDGFLNRIDPYDGRVHSNFNIHITATGRLSSTDPNIQNVPRIPYIKGQIQAPPGFWLLECDLSQAELRVMALVSGDPEMLAIYREGRKLHHEVCVQMYGQKFNEIPEDDWTLEMAQQYIRAKAVNFGILYGRQAPSLATEFKISVNEAQRLIDVWFDRFQVAYECIQETRRAPLEGRELITKMGRRKRPSLVTDRNLGNLQNEACNFLVQGPASDINLVAAYRVKDLVHLELGSKIVDLVHDSTLFEIPQDMKIATAIAQHMEWHVKDVTVEYLGDAIPMEIDAKIGTEWGALKKFRFDSLPVGAR